MLDTGEPGEVAGPTGFIYRMGLILAVSLTHCLETQHKFMSDMGLT